MVCEAFGVSREVGGGDRRSCPQIVDNLRPTGGHASALGRRIFVSRGIPSGDFASYALRDDPGIRTTWGDPPTRDHLEGHGVITGRREREGDLRE